MAIKFHNPKSVSVAGKYSLGVEVPPEARVLYEDLRGDIRMLADFIVSRGGGATPIQ